MNSDKGDCDPEVLTEWLIQWRIHLNRADYLKRMSDVSQENLLINFQLVRRNFEDLDCPSCADKLYMATIAYFNSLADLCTLIMFNYETKNLFETIKSRKMPLVKSLFKELRSMVDIDVAVEAEKRESLPQRKGEMGDISP